MTFSTLWQYHSIPVQWGAVGIVSVGNEQRIRQGQVLSLTQSGDQSTVKERQNYVYVFV